MFSKKLLLEKKPAYPKKFLQEVAQKRVLRQEKYHPLNVKYKSSLCYHSIKTPFEIETTSEPQLNLSAHWKTCFLQLKTGDPPPPPPPPPEDQTNVVCQINPPLRR
jgi:hypothetical protein